MIKFTGVFDNNIASPMPLLDFVKEYYLSTMGRRELMDASIEQESEFAALKNEESAQHSLQQLKAEIAAILSKCDHVFSKDTFVRIECSDFDRLRQLSAV